MKTNTATRCNLRWMYASLMLTLTFAYFSPMAVAADANYCPYTATSIAFPKFSRIDFFNTTFSKEIQPGRDVSVDVTAACSSSCSGFGCAATLTCGAYISCGGPNQLKCPSQSCSSGTGAFESLTVPCDTIEDGINDALEDDFGVLAPTVNLGANQQVPVCLECGGSADTNLACPQSNGNRCNAGFNFATTNGLHGSLSSCGYGNPELYMANTYGVCSPGGAALDLSRSPHDSWPTSETANDEPGTVLLVHGRGSSCGASMGEILDSGDLLSRGHLTYCAEYAQVDGQDDPIDRVNVYQVSNGARGSNSACIGSGSCSFDTAAPVLSLSASFSVDGVTGALYQALQSLPVEGDITLVGHSQGGFITRDLAHRYYDELRWRGRTISRVINLGHPHFGLQFDPSLYTPFLCIDQPGSFDCEVSKWLWGWQELLGSGVGPANIDNSEMPQIQWSVVSGEGAAGALTAESQEESCVRIFGGIDEATVFGDGSVPIESTLGRDEFSFFPGADEINVDVRHSASIGVSHNGAGMLNDYIANFPQKFPEVVPAVRAKTALAFYKEGSSIGLGNSAPLISSQLTLELWFKPMKDNQTTVFAGKDGQYYLAIFNGELYFALNDSATGWSSTATGHHPKVGRWSHVAMSYNNQTVFIYIDGVLINIFTAPNGDINDFSPQYDEFRLGSRQHVDGTNSFVGYIDEVRLWNRALSTTEIHQAMGPVASDAAGLQLWWRFSEQSGNTVADASVNARHTTLDSTSATLQPERVAAGAVNGSGLYFDGIDDQVAVVDSDAQLRLDMDSTLTLEAWIFPRGTGGAGNGTILSNEGQYSVYRMSNGYIGWSLDNDNPNWSAQSTNAYAPDFTWSHVALSYDGESVKTYINGALADTQFFALGGAIGDRHPEYPEIRIGSRQQTAGAQFHGVIDEVRIWSSVRTDSEIAGAYATGVDPTLPGLRAYWQFSWPDIGVAIDSSSYGNHAALAGNAGRSSQAFPASSHGSALPSFNHVDVRRDTDGDGEYDDVDLDDDNDLMSDEFELQYGFNPLDPGDGDQDADNDGRSNADEAMDGGNPLLVDTGDINGDGEVGIVDLLLLERSLIGLQALSAQEISRGDFNRDSELKLDDSLGILRVVLAM